MSVKTRSVCEVIDFTEKNIRFVNRDHSGLSLPGGYTQYTGLVVDKASGTKFDSREGKLTVGKFTFIIPDYGSALTQFVAANDLSLYRSKVVRRVGLVGQDESEYTVTNWRIEDYGVSSDGGGYKFILMNVLALIAEQDPLYIEYEDLEPNSLQDDIDDSQTTIELKEIPYRWPEPGFAFLRHPQTKNRSELIRYSSISTDTLNGVTRQYAGCGPTWGDGSFPEDGTEVIPCWVKGPGNPVDLMLEWLTSTDEGEDAAEVLPDPGLENWTNFLLDSYWITNNPAVGLGSIEETEHHGGTRCAKVERYSSSGWFELRTDNFTGLVPGKWYRWSCWCRGTDAEENLWINIENATKAKYLNTDGSWQSTGRIFTGKANEEWTFYWGWFQVDPTFDLADQYQFEHTSYYEGTIWYDDHSIFGPFTSQGNGPFDVGDGQGLGDLLSYEDIDIDRVLEVRDMYWPIPSFDADGDVRDGHAMMFIRAEEIDNVLEFCEDHVLRTLAMWAVTSRAELFSIEPRFQAYPTLTVIDDEWNMVSGRPGDWKRNWKSAVNFLEVHYGYIPGEDDYVRVEEVRNADSVSYFGERPPIDLYGDGYPHSPDLSSSTDLNIGASRTMLSDGNPWSPIKLTTFHKYQGVGLAERVRLNIPAIPDLDAGVRGIVRGTFVILGKTVTKSDVELNLRQRRTLYKPAFWAPNDVAQDYDDATDEDKAYCYLTPDDDDEFDDGEPSYKIVETP